MEKINNIIWICNTGNTLTKNTDLDFFSELLDSLTENIIIVESSPLDTMFMENNLPVVIGQNFSILNKWTLTDLEKLKEKYLPLTNFKNIEEKFDPEYWIKGE